MGVVDVAREFFNMRVAVIGFLPKLTHDNLLICFFFIVTAHLTPPAHSHPRRHSHIPAQRPSVRRAAALSVDD